MYEFKVEGMSCQSCVNSISKAVATIDPDSKVRVDLGEQKVTIESIKTIDELSTLVEDAGFTVLSKSIR